MKKYSLFLLFLVSVVRADTTTRVYTDGNWTFTVTWTVTIFPNLQNTGGAGSAIVTRHINGVASPTAPGDTDDFYLGGYDVGTFRTGGGIYGAGTSDSYVTANYNAGPGWTYSIPSSSDTLVSTTGAGTTMTGAQVQQSVTVSIPAGQIPSQLINSSGMVAYQALQGGVVISNGTLPADYSGSLSINTTSSDPVTIQWLLPGYVADANGGLLHTGNLSQNVAVNASVTQGNTTGNTYLPFGLDTPSLGINVTDFATLPGANNSTAGVNTSSPVIWTNPASGNGNYTQAGDPLSQSVFKQGITNLIAGDDQLAKILATPASANFDLTPVTNAINTTNGQFNGTVLLTPNATQLSTLASSMMSVVASSVSSAASAGDSLSANMVAGLNATGLTTLNPDLTPYDPTGALVNMNFTLGGGSFGSHTVDVNPLNNSTINALVLWIKRLMVILTYRWMYRQIFKQLQQSYTLIYLTPSITANTEVGLASNDTKVPFAGYNAVLFIASTVLFFGVVISYFSGDLGGSIGDVVSFTSGFVANIGLGFPSSLSWHMICYVLPLATFVYAICFVTIFGMVSLGAALIHATATKMRIM